MNVLERTLENAVRKTLVYNGFLVIKLPASYLTGLPDRLILGPNRTVYFIEFKNARRSVVSAAQEYWHGIIKKLGFGLYVIKTFDEFLIAHDKEINRT